MHAFSILTLGIFIAGYSTARWDLVTRLHELAIFAWDHGVVTRAAKGVGLLSVFFFLLVLPVAHLAAQETDIVSGSAWYTTGEEADNDSTHVSLVAGSLRASSSSAAGPSSGVAGWRYGHIYGADARILAIRCAP
jgi:phosphatidylinositol glycan class Q protein